MVLMQMLFVAEVLVTIESFCFSIFFIFHFLFGWNFAGSSFATSLPAWCLCLLI